MKKIALLFLLAQLSLAETNLDVECRYHTSSATLGNDVIGVVGWRPTDKQSGRGLGRCPTKTKEECEAVVAASSDGIVCTNTCIGWKVTSVMHNNWCGSSVTLDYCLKSSAHAKRLPSGLSWACSYPADGQGKLNDWVATRMGSGCEYNGPHQTLESCLDTVKSKPTYEDGDE